MYEKTRVNKGPHTCTTGFLLPSSPLPQVAESVGAGDVIGGSWSSILFSLDVAVGLWPLLREGLRSSRLRPGALTRPCAS